MNNLNVCFLFVLICILSTKSLAVDRGLLFERAASLGKGISVTWLEQNWEQGNINKDEIGASDIKLIASMGFSSVRLPVAFDYFLSGDGSFKLSDQLMARIDQVWKNCKQNKLKLIIDYHYGKLSNENSQTETQKIIAIWNQMLLKYKGEAYADLFFELYNEPVVSDQVWRDVAYNIVGALRKTDNGRTFIIGASNYNSIYELSRFVRLADENIIYTFHFYEPFIFTHQGADWVGNQVATTGIPFPYRQKSFPLMNAQAKNTWGETNYYQYKTDGNERSVFDKLLIAKKWSDKYYVPVLCGEYGVYNKFADKESRCKYLSAVNKALKQYRIPGIIWEYNGNFSIFDGKPAKNNISFCVKEALELK